MHKKIACIGLMGVISLYGGEIETSIPKIDYVSETIAPIDYVIDTITPLEETTSIESKRKKRKFCLWFKAIIPSILSYGSLEALILFLKKKEVHKQWIKSIKNAQWLPIIIGTYCLNIWMDTDLREWMLNGSKYDTSVE